MEQPRFSTGMILAIIATLLLVLGFFIEPHPLAYLFLGISLVLYLYALFATANWGFFAAGERVAGIKQASVSNMTTLADSIRELTGEQLDLIKDYEVIRVVAKVTGNIGLFWELELIGGKVPYDFVGDYFAACLDTYPQAWSANRAYEIGSPTWSNAERHANVLINDMVIRGYAKRGAGRYSARLNFDVPTIAAIYGIDLEGQPEHSPTVKPILDLNQFAE